MEKFKENAKAKEVESAELKKQIADLQQKLEKKVVARKKPDAVTIQENAGTP